MTRWVAVVGGLSILVSACGGPVAGFDEASVPVVDLFDQPVPDAPDPAERAGAAARYVDCTHPMGNGGWSADFGPPGSGSSPATALERFLGDGLFSLPKSGYAATGREGDRWLFTYSVADVPKVAVIVAGEQDIWQVETFASCDPAEYDPEEDRELSVEVWTDADGNRVPTSIITSLRGAEHCGWSSVTYLLFEDRQYISDPRGVMDVRFVTPFDSDADLPSGSVDTGYHRDGRQLWLSADRLVAYLVSDDHIEAWPTPEGPDPVWCA